jgi:endo-1,3-1,4-beta-glycanase ExoK
MNAKTAHTAIILAAILLPASAMGMASAELYNTKAYTYGRFDARIRFAPGDGVVSAFFLWKEGSEQANAYWAELDYEKIASDCRMQINSMYGKPKSQHQLNPKMGVDICGGYHDYRIEWTPTTIAWIVDGKEIRRDSGEDATAYSQNASGGMTMHFNIWPGNASFGGNINNTTLPVHQYISWVRYSSYDNDNDSFNVQWTEEFQSSGVPSGWSVGTWASAYNLSTHNPQNVSFVDGIAVLSLTADDATGNPGTPPADDGTTGPSAGEAGTGGTPSSSGGSSGDNGSSGGCSMVSQPGKAGLPSLAILMAAAWLRVLTRGRRNRTSGGARRSSR